MHTCVVGAAFLGRLTVQSIGVHVATVPAKGLAPSAEVGVRASDWVPGRWASWLRRLA